MIFPSTYSKNSEEKSLGDFIYYLKYLYRNGELSDNIIELCERIPEWNWNIKTEKIQKKEFTKREALDIQKLGKTKACEKYKIGGPTFYKTLKKHNLKSIPFKNGNNFTKREAIDMQKLGLQKARRKYKLNNSRLYYRTLEYYDLKIKHKTRIRRKDGTWKA
jgi:hypothetical protein